MQKNIHGVCDKIIKLIELLTFKLLSIEVFVENDWNYLTFYFNSVNIPRLQISRVCAATTTGAAHMPRIDTW